MRSSVAALTTFTEGMANPEVRGRAGAHVTIRIDLAEERVWRDGVELRLRRKAFAILKHLARSPRRVVTRDEIIEGVWGRVAMSESLLRTHVRDLRQVLGEGVVETVVGRGYRVIADVTYLGDTTHDEAEPVAAKADGRPVVAHSSAQPLNPVLARLLLQATNQAARCDSALVVLHSASSNEVRALLGFEEELSDARPLLLVVCLVG